MKERRVTMKDVAKAAGVSRSCVSFVLNGRWREMQINPKTQHKVTAAARKLNFHPHVWAQELRSGKSRMLGLLLLEPIENPFTVEIISGLHKHAGKHNYGLLISMERDPSLALRWLLNRSVAGVFVGPSFFRCKGAKANLLEMLRTNRVKFTVCGWCEDPDLNFVNLDYFGGGYRSAEHLIKLGHTKIGYFGGKPGSDPALKDRYRGYRKALDDHNIEFRKEWFKKSGEGWRGGYQAMREFLTRPALPSALVGHNDMAVLGGLRALAEKGLRVPQDMAVVGDDDIAAASFGPIPLTTMTFAKDQLYSTWCENLVGLVGGDSEKKQFYFKKRLVIRKSCGYFLNRVIPGKEANLRDGES